MRSPAEVQMGVYRPTPPRNGRPDTVTPLAPVKGAGIIRGIASTPFSPARPYGPTAVGLPQQVARLARRRPAPLAALDAPRPALHRSAARRNTVRPDIVVTLAVTAAIIAACS